MINFDFDEHCCGCGACANSCPVGAIAMKANSEGFLMPEIDRGICRNCGKCDEACPRGNAGAGAGVSGPGDLDGRKAYLYWSLRPGRRDSASGGFVYDLSCRTVDGGGFVCGCVWDDGMRARHVVSDRREDLRRMQSSKYVQSDTGRVFEEIGRLLRGGGKVMFCGTPCQTAGLRRFLGKTDTSGLVSVCLVCHGVPSPLAWERYKEALEERYGGVMVGANMRDKSRKGYSNPYCKYVFSPFTGKGSRKDVKGGSREGCRHVYKRTFTADPYVFLFTDNLYIRKSCTRCPYKGRNSRADVIVGDFYASTEGAGEGGCSCVVALTPKGEGVMRSLGGAAREYAVGAVCEANPMIYKSAAENPRRADFFKDLQGGRDGGLRLFTRYLPFRFYVKRALAQAGMFNVIRRLLRG